MTELLSNDSIWHAAERFVTTEITLVISTTRVLAISNDFLGVLFYSPNPWDLTFEKVGCETSLVDRAIRHKLHPELVGTGLNVIWLVVTTEASHQWAVLGVPIPHLQVVIGTAVMPLNLRKGWVNGTRLELPSHFHSSYTKVAEGNDVAVCKNVIMDKGVKGTSRGPYLLPQRTGRSGRRGSLATH